MGDEAFSSPFNVLKTGALSQFFKLFIGYDPFVGFCVFNFFGGYFKFN